MRPKWIFDESCEESPDKEHHFHGSEFSQDMPPRAYCCHCGNYTATYEFAITKSLSCGNKV